MGKGSSFEDMIGKCTQALWREAAKAGLEKPQISAPNDAMPRARLGWAKEGVHAQITLFFARATRGLPEPHIDLTELRVWVTDPSGKTIGRMTESSTWTLLPGEELEDQVAEYISAANSVTIDDIMAENEMEEIL